MIADWLAVSTAGSAACFYAVAVVRIWEREKEKKRERILWRGVVAISLL